MNPPTYDNMSPSELEAFLSEMESDIRSAERDLREISALEAKGVTGAGKLGDYEALQPRLEALLKAHNEDLQTAADLERRIALLMDRYATNVSVHPLTVELYTDLCRSIHCRSCSFHGINQLETQRRRFTRWRKTEQNSEN